MGHLLAAGSDPGDGLSLPGLGFLLVLGLASLGAGGAVRVSDGFYSALAAHAERQRRLHRLPPIPITRYDKDRRAVATVLIGLGAVILFASVVLVLSDLTIA